MKLFIRTSILALLLTLFSIFLLDAPLALYIKQFLSSSSLLNRKFRNIPNLLPITVFIGTAAMWILFLRAQHRGNTLYVSFLKLAAIAVPSAFLLKKFLQFAFGRTNIRVWLTGKVPLEFTWFTPLSQNPCFPSGHMTVFTSFFVAVWMYYPRYRLLASLVLAALAVALVFTNYHFLGDVIAGFFCGILVTTTIEKCIVQTQDDKAQTTL